MALNFWTDFPFITPNKMILLDTYTSDGTSTYTLRGKSSPFVGGTIQADATLYFRYLNGFSFPTAQTFTLSSSPPVGAQIVVPGTVGLNFDIFDATDVPGQTSPANVKEVAFYLADDGLTTANILINSYNPVSGNPGIAIFFQNMATAAGASTAWCQLSCADASGAVIGYQATGTTLYTAPLQAFSSLIASSAALSTSMTLLSASGGFYAGDYVIVNPGGGTQETVKILALNQFTGVCTITGFNYDHSAGEQVFVCGRKFWAKGTLPIGILGGVAQSFINLGLVYDTIMTSR